MTNSRFSANPLGSVAFGLAQEIWEKKWEHVADLKTKPVPECVDIIRELERRCPGHTLEQYKRAIAQGMHDSR